MVFGCVGRPSGGVNPGDGRPVHAPAVCLAGRNAAGPRVRIERIFSPLPELLFPALLEAACRLRHRVIDHEFSMERQSFPKITPSSKQVLRTEMSKNANDTFSRRDVAGLAAAVAALAASPALANQGHMESAIDACQLARHELNQATHNKGGHRVKAIQLIDAAIAEIKAGIAAGS